MKRDKKSLYERYLEKKEITTEKETIGEQLHQDPETIVIKKVSGSAKFLELLIDTVIKVAKIIFWVGVSLMVSLVISLLLNPGTRTEFVSLVNKLLPF